LNPLRQWQNNSEKYHLNFLKAEAQSRTQEREAMARGDAMFHARMVLHFGNAGTGPGRCLDVSRMVQ
jgi:hypothetical protein